MDTTGSRSMGLIEIAATKGSLNFATAEMPVHCSPVLPTKLFKPLRASAQRDAIRHGDGSPCRCQADSWTAGDPLVADEFGDCSLVFALRHFPLTFDLVCNRVARR